MLEISMSIGLNLALVVTVLILFFQLRSAKRRIGHDQKTEVNWFWRVAPKIERLLKRASRGDWHIAIAMLDLDFFKKVNDDHPDHHQYGDRILRELCQVILEAIRPLDILTRYGGEEFLLAFIITDGTNQGFDAAERIRKAVVAHVFEGGLRLTVSIGVAVCPDQATSLEDLILKADGALYEAKAAGRDRVVISR